MNSKKNLSIVMIILGVFYPFLVYFGVAMFSLRTIALLTGISLLIGIFLQIDHSRKVVFLTPLLIAIVLCGLSVFLKNPDFVLYLPCLFSLSLFFSFGYTLLYPPSIVEVFARMVAQERSPEEIAYCRQVTIMWVMFFTSNSIVAFYTACCMSLNAWSLYNGLLSYGVIGILFTAELCYRYWRFRRYAGLRTDVLFKRLFPPKE